MSQVEHEVRYEDLPPLPYAGFGLRLVAAMLDIIVLSSVFLLFVSGAALAPRFAPIVPVLVSAYAEPVSVPAPEIVPLESVTRPAVCRAIS